MSRVKQTEDLYSSPDLLASKFRAGRNPFFEIEAVTQNVQASSSGGGGGLNQTSSGGGGIGSEIVDSSSPYGGDRFNPYGGLEQ